MLSPFRSVPKARTVSSRPGSSKRQLGSRRFFIANSPLLEGQVAQPDPILPFERAVCLQRDLWQGITELRRHKFKIARLFHC